MYSSYIMKRTQIYLDVEQDQRLARRAASTGITKSTLIREAIDAYLDAPADDATRLARFRTAVRDIARTRVDLPSGRDYVEALRASDVRRQEEIERRRR
jgi:predicted DNA-binding protein